ncbi:MAG: universal stress protein [Thermomicrobiales bacterium]
METFGPLNSRILVPLDGSDLATNAIPVARALASPGSTLILCRIVPESRRLDDGGAAPTPAVADAWREAEAALRAQAARIQPTADVRAEIVVEAGEPGECIVGVAKDRSAGMIVLSSHGRGAGGRLLFGSVADFVTRNAPMPVVLIHPTDEQTPAARAVRRLVVPLDESPLAHQAIPVAAALAKRRRLPVLLLAAADPTRVDSPLAGYAAAFSERVYDDLESSLKPDALGELERSGARLMREGVVATWRLLSGPAARVIPAVLSAGDLVVVASQRLDRVERWWRGSLAEELIQSGVAPVMVVGVTPTPAAVDKLATVESVAHA